jgi:hypothetical protein
MDIAYPGLDSYLLELKVLIPLWTQTPSQFRLVSSIFFLSSPGQLTRVTFTLLAYPIGLSKSHLNSLPELHPSALPDRINTYLALYVHTRPNCLTRFISQSDFYLPDLTWSYPAELPYSVFSQSDFCLSDCIRPPYPTSLPDRVTLHCTRLLTQPYPITLSGRVPFNWPHSKTSSLASHLDLGLFWSIMLQNSSGNPKPTRVTLNQSE